MNSSHLEIQFVQCSAAEAEQFATEFLLALGSIDPSIRASRIRESHTTQDLGSTLVVLFGTASVASLAKGIANWMSKNAGARVELRRDGDVIISGLESRDAAKIVEALYQRQ